MSDTKTSKTSEVVCGMTYASCFCIREYGHEGLHECDCGGSFLEHEDGRFEIGRLPGIFGDLLPEFATTYPAVDRV